MLSQSRFGGNGMFSPRQWIICLRFLFLFFSDTLVGIIEFIPWWVSFSACCFCVLNDRCVAQQLSTHTRAHTHTHMPILLLLAFRQMPQTQRGCWLLEMYPDISLQSYSSWNDLIQPTCSLKKQLHNYFRSKKNPTTETQKLSGKPLWCSYALNCGSGITYLEAGIAVLGLQARCILWPVVMYLWL